MILSLGVPLSGFLGNPFSQYLIDVFGDETAVKFRFMVFGAACMFSMVIFYLTTADPENENNITCNQENSDSQLDSEKTSMMETKTNFVKLHDSTGTSSIDHSTDEPVNKKTQSNLNLELLRGGWVKT